MYWILTERVISLADMKAILQTLFPELHFHDVDTSTDTWYEHPFLHYKDGKNYTYSIERWTDKLKSKIEFHDIVEDTAIEITQYIGQSISKTYQSVVVTELGGEYKKNSYPYYSLLIDSEALFIIDDMGIEDNGYDLKIIQPYQGSIKKFNPFGQMIF